MGIFYKLFGKKKKVLMIWQNWMERSFALYSERCQRFWEEHPDYLGDPPFPQVPAYD